MKRIRLFSGLVILLFMLFSFVACNGEIETELIAFTEISFAPSANKSLNQGGSSTEFSTSITDYHWRYYCSTSSATPTTDSDWQDFPEAETGLGVIKDLFRGDSYFFGLRGYKKDTSYTDADLIWEGYHNGGAVTLTTKRQLITVDVYPKGVGYLYFNITAPKVTDLGFDNGVCLHPDRFWFAYESLDGKTSGSDFLYSTYTSLTESFDYADEAGVPRQTLPAGTYLFTVKQQTWDTDILPVTSTSTDAYIDVDERAQIIIVNIVSGVDTVIGGTLDSAGLVQFDYKGYSTDDQHGLLINYNQKTGSVERLAASVYRSGSPEVEKSIHNNDRLLVEDGDYVVIRWTTDADLISIYFNGDLVSTDTDANGYLVRAESDEEWTYLKTSGTDTLAYGKFGSDYIVTGVYEGKAVSFTVVGTQGHVHTYSVQEDGSWMCDACDAVVPGTDAPYFAFVSGTDSIAINDIVVTRLTSAFDETNHLSFAGNLVKFEDNSAVYNIYLRTAEGQSVIIEALLSNVHHYGKADYTEIKSVADSSYHLFGEVKDLVVNKGNVVIEEKAKVEDLSVAKDAATSGSGLTLTVKENNSVEVFAFYDFQAENVMVNGVSAKTVTATDVTKSGKVSIAASNQARIGVATYDSVEAAQKVGSSKPVRIVNDTVLNSVNSIETSKVMKIGSGVNVSIATEVEVDALGELENHGVVTNYSVLSNVGKITNYGEINTTGTDAELNSVSKVNNYGSIVAESNGKIETSGTDAKIENYGTVNVAAGSSLNIKSSVVLNGETGKINYAGTINNSGNIGNLGTITKEADGTITGNTSFSVATIVETSKCFDSLAAAISAADADQTIIVLDDITLNNSIVIEKSLKLDLNGKTIDAAETSNWQGASPTKQALFYVKSGAKLTIDDSSSSKQGMICVKKNGNDYVNTTIYSAIILTVSGNNDSSKNAELEINAGSFDALYCSVMTNGLRSNTSIVINGGYFKNSIYHPDRGSLTINGGTFVGYDGLDIKGGTPVTITGGTFIATGDRVDPSKAEGSGTNNVGSALYVEGNYGYGAQVLISGGTFTTSDTNAPAIRSLFNENTVATISITGGSYSSDPSEFVAVGYAVYTESSLYKVAAYKSSTWSHGKTIISGTFNAEPSASHIADGYLAIANSPEAGKWSVNVASDLLISKSGEANQYMSLTSFRDSVNAGNSYAGYTVTLLKDIDLQGDSWDPIGSLVWYNNTARPGYDTSAAKPFSGTFDGGNHTIYNMTIDGNSELAGLGTAGFFGNATGAVIKNLNFVGANVNLPNNELVGVVVGGVLGGSITLKDISVDSTSSVVAGDNIGVIIGSAFGDYDTATASFENLVSSAGISASGAAYAGMVTGSIKGYKTITCKNCENNGNIKLTATPTNITYGMFGGIIGYLQGNTPRTGMSATSNNTTVSFISCSNNGEILGYNNAAGIVSNVLGGNQLGSVSFSSCTNSGSVSLISGGNTGAVGSLFGYAGNLVGATPQIVIDSCTNTGSIGNNNAKKAGGLFGWSQSSVSINNCTIGGSVTCGSPDNYTRYAFGSIESGTCSASNNTNNTSCELSNK